MITVDIGNTTTQFRVFSGEQLKMSETFATLKPEADENDVAPYRRLLKQLSASPERHAAILCSVVPQASGCLAELLASAVTGLTIVGKDIRVPLINRYTFPDQVGQDRLVCAYAVWCPNPADYIVVDFGTAITIDWVTKKGEYMGGVIAPGLEVSAEALALRTALLPRVPLKVPPEVLGKQTEHSIQSGLVFGTAELCDGIIRRLKKTYAPQAHVVATGGAAGLLLPFMEEVKDYRVNLVHDGLFLLMRK